MPHFRAEVVLTKRCEVTIEYPEGFDPGLLVAKEAESYVALGLDEPHPLGHRGRIVSVKDIDVSCHATKVREVEGDPFDSR
jgi:hypothetical protein